MPTFCPVCGYDLALADPNAHPEPCLCCAFDFQEHRDKKPYSYFAKKTDRVDLFVRIWRGMWTESHLPWRGRTVPKPEGWDPVVQLRNIGIDWGESFEAWMEKHPVITPENKDKFLALVREKLQNLTWRPEFIEANWDGDTQGWFLPIWVSARKDDGQYNMSRLWSFRGGGWDAGPFIARYLLDEISKELNIPSYFPAPDLPDDSFARYWERDKAKPCPGCGLYVIDGFGAFCRACHDREEQVKKST